MILETIQSDSAPYVFQSNMRYKLIRRVMQEFVLNDSLNQNIYLDADQVHLKAASLNDLQHEGKWLPCHSSPPWVSLLLSAFKAQTYLPPGLCTILLEQNGTPHPHQESLERTDCHPNL